MNVLKIRKELQLIVLLSGLLLTAFSASAQDFTNDQKILADYQKSVDSLLTKTKSVTATAALAVLKAPSITLEINLAKDTKKALSPNALYEFAKKSILIVGCSYLCPKCSNTHLSESTGYVIDAKGIVVTNYHVVNTYADMHDGFKPVAFTVRLANGHVYAVKSILTASKKNDLAILQLETNGDMLPALPLAKSANVGDQVFVLGHPKGMHYFFSQGNVTNRYMEEAGPDDARFFREMMTISADYATGSSGGPVLDLYGRVVGTVSNTKMYTHSEMNPSVQMVVKNTVPVESLWKLIRSESNQ